MHNRGRAALSAPRKANEQIWALALVAVFAERQEGIHGAKARIILPADAALKRRSSTVVPAVV